MKAILINTNRTVCEIEIENALEAMQEQVGGYIEMVEIGEGLVAICNEEGKLEGLPPVALILSPDGTYAQDALCGPVLICRTAGADLTDIRPGDEWEMQRRLFVLPVIQGAAV